MNILILNWKDIKNPHRGGAEVIAHEFAKRLVAEGNEVTFFSRCFSNALPEETIDDIRIIRRGNFISVYLFAYLYYLSLKRKPDKVIDMVNTVCWQTPLYVPQERRIMYVNQLAKEVFFYELPFPISWICYFLEKFEYITYKHTKVICYSESTRHDLIDFNIPSENIQLFPMGLDHARYLEGVPKSKNPLFVFVARLVKMKRAALCVDAMELFIKKYPKAKLVIIGNGPEEDNLAIRIRKGHIEKAILLITQNNFFLKKMNHDIKITTMQEAWALLLPSVKEGWGMVVTEAAACGTPAIVTDVTGLRDSVIKNKTGFIISSNPTARELCDAMEKIVDKNIQKELSKNSLQWADTFQWEISYNKFRKIVLS